MAFRAESPDLALRLCPARFSGIMKILLDAISPFVLFLTFDIMAKCYSHYGVLCVSASLRCHIPPT